MSNHQFYPLKVKKIDRLTPDCVAVEFDIPTSLNESFTFQPGQHLTLATFIDNKEVRRPYSISSAPGEAKWEVAIKRVEGGIFSTFANHQLKVGDTLQVMPPDGNFRIRDHKEKSIVVAFAAGSGITPILSMIKSTLQDESKSFTLFYGNKNTESIIYREEIESLKNKYLDRFSVHYILSKEKLGSPLQYGRINADKCKMFLNYLIEKEEVSQYLLCGPGNMIFEVKEELIANGVDPQMIHFELFTTTDLKIEEDTGLFNEEDYSSKGFADVKIRIDGLVSTYQIPYKGKSIMQWAVDEGADIPFSCKGGVCSTCRAKLLEGEVSMDINYALESDEIKAGFILTCQSHPRSTNITIDFDEK